MPQLLAHLKGQGGQYTLEIITPSGEFSDRCINLISRMLSWSYGLHHIVALGRNAETRIILLTVTEAGYFLD